MAEVVHPELHLEPVLRPPLEGRHDAGVVDEDVDARVRRDDASGRITHGAERREIERHRLERRTGDLGHNRGARVLGLGLVARSHHDVRALARELPRDLEPEPPFAPVTTAILPDRSAMSPVVQAMPDGKSLAARPVHLGNLSASPP